MDFNISEDLTITNGTIDTDSLNYEGNGTYSFQFSLNQPNVVSQIRLNAGLVHDRYDQGNEAASIFNNLDAQGSDEGAGPFGLVAF